MNTFIAYDKNTFRILAFIKNDYSKIEDTQEVFQNFENYDVVQTNLEVPNFFENYKVILEDDRLIGFEEVENENI